MKKIKIPKLKKRKKDGNNKKSIWRIILSLILVGAIILVSLLLAFSLYIVISSPNFEKQELFQTEPSIIYDVNGDELARVGAEDSTVVSYDELPEVLIDALVATEDSRFFQHNGIDLFRFMTATFKTLLGSDSAGGASTLSMQVIKNTYTKKGEKESKRESIVRKFRDIYMAVFKLEANYTKEEIIEFYLNSQWFAGSTSINTSGTTGVERASQYYFGKSVKDISLAEASLMAGMFQNPYRYNLYTNPEGCRNRQTTVLKLMVRHGYITENQMNEVLEIPISTLLKGRTSSSTKVESKQAFIDYVINEVNSDLELNARQTSLKIYTTFDPKVQSYLEDIENGDAFKFPNDEAQEAIAITSVKDGSVVAMSGGRKYQAMGNNRAITMNRQPGSTAKPIFDYAMYIEHINQSTYAMFLDEPTTYSNGTSISNYDNKFKGLVTMRFALEDSRNIPALLAFKEVNKLDPNIIKDFVHSVGINYGDDLYESAAIGGFNGVSPLELSAAYATFARGGYYIKPYGYTKVINNTTGTEYTNSYTKTQVMEESTAFMINDILDGAYGSDTDNIAGKTGTTNLTRDDRTRWNLKDGTVSDVWFVTYNSNYASALWYGYDRFYKESKENGWFITSGTGGNARKTIMKYIVNNLYKKNEAFSVPKTVKKVQIELRTFPAQLCSSYTPSNMCVSEYFVSGTEPTDESNRYATLSNPTNGTYTITGNILSLNWDPISTPDAISSSYLRDHFDKYYGNYADKYYNERIADNSNTFGTLGYEVYLKDSNGIEKYIGFTNSNSFVYNLTNNTEYTFVIKSTYSKFKANSSSGLTINVKIVDNPITNIIENNNTTDNTDYNIDNDNNNETN